MTQSETTTVLVSEIQTKLAELNQAQQQFANASTRDAKNVADMTFQQCLDWLDAHGVAYHIDHGDGMWKLGGRA